MVGRRGKGGQLRVQQNKIGAIPYFLVIADYQECFSVCVALGWFMNRPNRKIPTDCKHKSRNILRNVTNNKFTLVFVWKQALHDGENHNPFEFKSSRSGLSHACS